MNLTDTQRAILALITEQIESEGVPPSQTEIASAFGFSSVRAAQYHLEALERAGAIQRVPGQARGIRLTQARPAANDDALRLPVLGRVAAGSDRCGRRNGRQDFVLLDKNFFRPRPTTCSR